VEGELGIAVAMLGTAHAGDAGDTRQVARLGDQAAGVAGRNPEAGARDGARRTGGDTGGVAPGATVAGGRHRRQRAVDEHERAIGPPGAGGRMNL
jgi:hypothetical protein